jgi:hypothetical protein
MFDMCLVCMKVFEREERQPRVCEPCLEECGFIEPIESDPLECTGVQTMYGGHYDGHES